MEHTGYMFESMCGDQRNKEEDFDEETGTSMAATSSYVSNKAEPCPAVDTPIHILFQNHVSFCI